MIGVLDIGGGAPVALARFGGEALEPVLIAARQPNPIDIFDVIGALKTLKLMVLASAPAASLAAKARNDIIAVTLLRLTGRQDPNIVSEACGLAIALDDSALRNRVAQLAVDRKALAEMGIIDARSAEIVQRAASNALNKK